MHGFTRYGMGEPYLRGMQTQAVGLRTIEFVALDMTS